MSDVSDQWWSGYASAVATPKNDLALAERLQRWSAKVSTALAGSRCGEVEAAQSTSLEDDDWSREFARTGAVAVCRDKAPVTPRRPSKVAAKGMRKVERQLAWLDDEWHVLHVVERGVELDYLLIGPAGVITLTLKCLQDAHVRVTDSRVLVDGHPTDYLRHALDESQRVRQVLRATSDASVRVQPAIVLAIFVNVTVSKLPADVHVTTVRQLLPWLKALPETTDPETVASIYACLCEGMSTT